MQHQTKKNDWWESWAYPSLNTEPGPSYEHRRHVDKAAQEKLVRLDKLLRANQVKACRLRAEVTKRFQTGGTFTNEICSTKYVELLNKMISQKDEIAALRANQETA